MSEYLTCVVKVNKEDLKEFLSNFYDEEDIENMSEWALQSQLTSSLEGILSDHLSDFYVIDKDTVVVGDI